MLFNMISLDSTGSAVFATAVITFLNMVALMVPRPDFGVLLAYQWLKILDDFRGICTDGVCSSKGTFLLFFAVFPVCLRPTAWAVPCIAFRSTALCTYLYCLRCCLPSNPALMVYVHIFALGLLVMPRLYIYVYFGAV